MAKRMPIHALRDTLEAARLQAIQELALAEGTAPSVSTETFRRVAFLQTPSLPSATRSRGGGEQPLE
jgi:hypothetical protein